MSNFLQKAKFYTKLKFQIESRKVRYGEQFFKVQFQVSEQWFYKKDL